MMMIMEKDKGQREAKHIKEILLTRGIDWKVRKTFLRQYHHHHLFFVQFFFSLCFCLVVFQYFKISLFLPCYISIFQNIFVFVLLYFNTSEYFSFCPVIFQYFEISLFLPRCISIFQNIFIFALLYFNISKRCRELGLVTRSASLAPELHPLWWSALSCQRSLPKIDYKIFHQKTSF